MSLKVALRQFTADVSQCDSLIATAHFKDAAGALVFSLADRRQILIAAFLNMFIAWESFLEKALPTVMTGKKTISGKRPKKIVSPKNLEAAAALIKGYGTRGFFDYSNHDHVRTLVSLYFKDGYPFEPHLGGLVSDLQDMKTIRNACAHISASTQKPLDGLAMRIFSVPRPNIDLYDLLTAIDPRDVAGQTVFGSYKAKLSVTVGLIAQG